jgi:DNA-binding NarL/FixJ family response regulator
MILNCEIKQKLKVLIVDDSSLVISRLHRILLNSENIARISDAHDFEEGKLLFDLESPDVVLLDIHLPGKSGLDLLRYIRKKYIQPKIIVISNETGDFYRERCVALGVDFFIDKTYEFEKLPGILFNL